MSPPVQKQKRRREVIKPVASSSLSSLGGLLELCENFFSPVLEDV